MKKIKLKIDGMHCTSCAMSIDGDLEDFVKGIKSANTNYAKQVCDVEFDDKQSNAQKIIEQVNKTGYKAKII